MNAGLSACVDAAGLARLYRLLLGREAEPAVLAAAEPRALNDLVGEMVTSDEIRQQVLHPLVQQRPVPHEALDPALMVEAVAWFGALANPEINPSERPFATLPVVAQVFGHPALSAQLLDAHGSLFTEAWQALQARARQAALRLEGRIEFANQEFVSGWACRMDGRGPFQVEVQHQGRLVASAVACSHRPDIQRRLGGDGLVGFRCRWNPGALHQTGPLMLTLHDAATGAGIGPAYRHENNPVDQVGVAQLLAREFESLHRRLDALAGMVPQALGYVALPLADIDLYRRLHRVPAPPGHTREPPPWAGVLLDANDASPAALRVSVDSLRALAPGVLWKAGVVGASGEAAHALATLSHADPRLNAFADWHAALSSLVAEQLAGWQVLMQAGECVDPQTLNWIVHEANSAEAPVLVFWDEDQLADHAAREPARPPRHHSPVLRARFDPHAMLELNVVGQSFAVQTQALRHAAGRLRGEGAALSPAQREALVWSLTRDGGFRHVPHFLLTRTDTAVDTCVGDGPLARMAGRIEPTLLGPLLPPAWRGREWVRAPDPLAAELGKPLVHWAAQRPRAAISVCIPTRDHGELVRQCLASLRALAVEPHALEFLVADNGSTDPITLAWLASAQAAGELRLLRVDEPFNWSRLNNHMAGVAAGEHLLFLNDDTRMLTRGWDALLRGQLEDLQVGAVGARLFYEDMTVQHAGVRFGQEGFLGHIAVGQSPNTCDGFPASQLTREVSAVTGAFLACRRSTWHSVGPFDEQRLAVTYNDVDWCIRVRRSGLKVLYAPAISLVHLESKSRGFDFMSASKQARAEHERGQLVQQHPGAFLEDPFHPPALSAWTATVPSLR